MRFKYVLFLCIVILLLSVDNYRDQNEIVMGYRTTSKLPYIQENPDNEGFYKDIYTEACRRIGYTLKIVRLPKARVLKGLEDGVIDFYPGFAYSEDRARYSFWINNRIKQQDVIITHDEVDTLESIEDLDGLRYLLSLGNSNALTDMDLGNIKTITVSELDLDRAIKMIKNKRADFYVYEENTIRYFIKSNDIDGIRFHTNVIEDFYWSHAGFSRNSPLFKGIPNPDYDPEFPQSIENFPFKLDEESVFYKLRSALEEMASDGTIDAYYHSYFYK